MDRDTVRLLLVLIGLLVLGGIYLWGRFKQPALNHLARLRKSGPQEYQEPDESEYEELPEYFEEEVRVITPETNTRKEPQLSAFDLKDSADLEDLTSTEAPVSIEPVIQETRNGPATGGSGGAPFLIQVSVVAGPGRFFHGPDLKQALLEADLLFGDMDIFHRYDRSLSQTLFSVASLVEPGTFPVDDMDDFECPGIVLFFQTARVANPLEIYDDLVNTSRELAHRLKGIQWDESRQPLSESKIAHMRNLLRLHPEALN